MTTRTLQDAAELSSADERVIRELSARARVGGLKLTSEGGLLGMLAKMVIDGAWKARWTSRGYAPTSSPAAPNPASSPGMRAQPASMRSCRTAGRGVRCCPSLGAAPPAPAGEIYLSQPGLGAITGTRVLGEFGDDPHRYASAKARRNYVGTSPITRASGKRKIVAARFVRNDRLIDALMIQAFAALRVSPGAHAFYDVQRAKGLEHNDALRRLASRLVGILHGCRQDPGPATTRPSPEATGKTSLNLTLPLDIQTPGMSWLRLVRT